jgi:hypothetical protein
MPVVALSQTEAFERSLVRSSDAVALRGKLLFTGAAGTTPSVLFTLNGSSLGTRCAALAGIFSRYRFKYLRVRFLAATNVSGGAVAIGVLDDASGSEGQPPTTISNVLELRASGTTLTGQTVPTIFEWKPADPNLWYYTSVAPASGSDIRLINSGTLYADATVTSTGINVEIDYSIVYKGAVDTSGF